MTNASTETRRTDWIEFGHHGASHYRIWQRTDGLTWQQRHEWRMADGSVRTDEWIRGATGWAKGMQQVST